MLTDFVPSRLPLAADACSGQLASRRRRTLGVPGEVHPRQTPLGWAPRLYGMDDNPLIVVKHLGHEENT